MAFDYMNIELIGPIMSGCIVVHPMISHIQVFRIVSWSRWRD